MTTWHAIVLGIVQGATEFLPVSSKTHLVVVPALFGWEQPSLAFLVWLHLGTLVALVGYFLRRLMAMAGDLVRPRSGGERGTLIALLVASIPAGVLGLLFEDFFERLLRHPRGAAVALVGTAVILVTAEWFSGTIGRRLARPLRDNVTPRDALAMGLAQCVALLPGFSRSGTTMSAGLASGLKRSSAAEFSFLMALVAIAGAGLLEAPKVIGDGLGGPEIAGFIASALTGYAVIAGLLRYLRTFSFLPFAAYCVAFAVLGAVRLS